MKKGLNELSFVIDFVDFSFVNDKVFKDLSFKNGMLSFCFLLLLLCHLICYCCGFVISSRYCCERSKSIKGDFSQGRAPRNDRLFRMTMLCENGFFATLRMTSCSLKMIILLQ